MAKKNFYVVWKGLKPGVYDQWDEAKAQVKGFEGAIYKSFPNIEDAQKAFSENPQNYLGKPVAKKPAKGISKAGIIRHSLSVDAACSPDYSNIEEYISKQDSRFFIRGLLNKERTT